MKTGILIRVDFGSKNTDLIHLTPHQLLNWYRTLPETSRYLLTSKLLDIIRRIPQ